MLILLPSQCREGRLTWIAALTIFTLMFVSDLISWSPAYAWREFFDKGGLGTKAGGVAIAEREG
jgi:hypothetical protein